MKVRILGTAAGGGLPQWNCGCAGCTRARAIGSGRTQDCVAISGDGTAWYLLNASPDLRVQLLAAPELAPPPGTRDTPIRGVLLTSAELDHTLGLLTLREAARLEVFATAVVRTMLPVGAILACYTEVDWRTVNPGEVFALPGGLAVEAIALSSKRPRYARDGPDGAWTVAYRVSDARTGAVLVYAPGLAEWTAAFAAGIADADLVILDGTFATADEFSPAGAARLGHLSIEDSLGRLPTGPGYWYTHLNNTNPYALDGDRPLPGRGARIARDGEFVEL